jgi:zinc protease
VTASAVTRFVPALLAVVVLAAAGVLPASAVTIAEVKSPGGITAWLVEDHSVPIVSASIIFRGGAALDPDDKAGLANLTTELLDEGAGDLDTTAFQSKLEDLSSALDIETGQDTISTQLRTLSANVAPTFDLLRLALTAPRFDAEPVERMRSAVLAALGRDQRQPVAIASRLWWKTAFAGHPYGRSTRGTPDSVAHITPDDMRGLVRARFAKDVLVIGVVGDITPAALGPLLDQTFGSLPDHAAPDTLTDVQMRRSNDVMVSELNIPQSVVEFGQQGLKRNDPDWYAALIVLNILSAGGLSSRVALEVREERGLAYSISASLNPLQHAGIILGQVGSQNAHVAESVELIRRAWRRMHDSGPTAKELADAKTYLTGSYALSLDSTQRIASVLVAIQLDHLGIDYLDQRNALIEKVSLADARRVAKRLLDPDGLSFVVVGSPTNLSDAQHVTPGG